MTAKILHIVNGEFYAGAERVQDLLAARLPEMGYEVGFACLKEGAFADARKTRDAPLTFVPMNSRFDFGVGERLAALIRSESYDAIHTHTPRSALAGYFAARATGLPVIQHIHSPAARDTADALRNFVNARIENFCARRAAKLIAVSQSLRSQLREAGHAESKIALVPNGVPVVSAASGWQRPQGAWTLGIAAFFRPRKGIEILLHALADLQKRGIVARLNVIGGFESAVYERQVKDLAERLGLGVAIRWRGFANDMNAEFAAIDLLVVPSLFGEGLPMVMIEAMAAGLPVVGTRVEGIPEVLETIASESVVPPGQHEPLADILEALIAGRLDARAWAQRGHARQRDFYSDRAMAAGVTEVYRSVGL